MKKSFKISSALLASLLALAAAYYVITPKVILSNLSDNEYDEFVIVLPTSRISFGPVGAHSTDTIFYSRQGGAGMGSYSLIDAGSELAGGEFAYRDGSEFGRVLRFTIGPSGLINIEEQ